MNKTCNATENVNDKLPLLDELDKMGVPRSAILCGFVVHLPDVDEFLHFYEDNGDSSIKGWAAFPGMAMRFPNAGEANFVARLCDKATAISCALFDVGDQYIVWEMPDENFE